MQRNGQKQSLPVVNFSRQRLVHLAKDDLKRLYLNKSQKNCSVVGNRTRKESSNGSRRYHHLGGVCQVGFLKQRNHVDLGGKLSMVNRATRSRMNDEPTSVFHYSGFRNQSTLIGLFSQRFINELKTECTLLPSIFR